MGRSKERGIIICRAFSCLVTKSEKVYWKLGVDSHDELHRMFEKKDVELKDDQEPHYSTFARIEITPQNGDYLHPDKWVYQIDEQVKPVWISGKHKKIALESHEEWKAQLYSKIAVDQMPEHPFKIKAPKITDKHLKLVKEWTSVRDSVRDSVGDSVWDSVGDSVRDSVWDSVGDSVRDSVWDSVWASVRDSVYGQIGMIFPGVQKWKYTENVKVKGYPFKSVVKLWRMGLVPVYYQGKWSLFGSENGDGKIKELWREK